MSKKEQSSFNFKEVNRHFTRAVLRMIPLFPGPELFDIVNELKKNRNSLDKKVQRAYSSLQETTKLVSELEENLEERAEKLNKLKEEYDRYSKLAEVEEEKAGALVDQLESSLDNRSSQERWISLGLNLLAGLVFFILGIFLSPTIKSWFGLN